MDLDGKALAEKIRAEHAPEVLALTKSSRRPRLLAIQVGKNEATAAYVRGQMKGAEAWKIPYRSLLLSEHASEEDVRAAIRGANADPSVTGILLQMPLPPSLHSRSLQREILPSKDVEGVHPENLGGVVHAREGLAPCTALAAVRLLESSGATIRGAEAVVVGHSDIVGKPVALMLLARDATVTVCHVYTKDLAAHTRRADLLVVAVGRAGLITPDMVAPHAVVVDVGINVVKAPGDKTPDGKTPNGRTKIVGDVDYDGLVAKGCRVSPVPGGVGPVTVAMLLRNTVLAARQSPAHNDADETPLFRYAD